MEMTLPGQPAMYRQWCLVYDARDGRVVHIHEFIAIDADGMCPANELERQALSHVVRCDDSAELKVLHPPAGVLPEPFVTYRVNLKDGALQVSSLSGTPHGKRLSPVLQRRALAPDEA